MTGPSVPVGLPSAWDIVIPTDDESITRRRRALAPIQVLTDLERTKASLAGDFWGDYDLFTVALAVIDQVALAMGVSAGKTWDDALQYAAEQAARQTPGRSQVEWNMVAERVLVALVTTEVEVVKHLVHTADGPAWRNQRFRLLYLHPSGGDGIEHLRASEQAINIFVEALDLDIEAAQIANEAQLTALIARGAVASAVEIARHARYRSIQYQERVRRIVADTLIDPDLHDWVGEVPALLDGALAHVSERLQAEAALLEAVADRRTEVTDRAQLEVANQLIEILRECRGRHHDLHRHLMGARSRLRQALDDRFARPPRAIRRVDIGRELLTPLLTRTTGDGSRCAERLVALFGGFPMRWWPSLTTLTDELCAPPRPPDLGDEFALPEIDGSDEPDWWEPYEATVDALIDGINEPIRLSQLLARAGDIAARADADGALDHDTLSAVLVHAAHRAWSTQLAGRTAGERVVVAVSTGARINIVNIGADDLLLVPGEVSEDIDAPAVQQPRTRFEDDEESAE